MAEPVIESSFLGLVYSVLAGSELLKVNQAEGLAGPVGVESRLKEE